MLKNTNINSITQNKLKIVKLEEMKTTNVL